MNNPQFCGQVFTFQFSPSWLELRVRIRQTPLVLINTYLPYFFSQLLCSFLPLPFLLPTITLFWWWKTLFYLEAVKWTWLRQSPFYLLSKQHSQGPNTYHPLSTSPAHHAALGLISVTGLLHYFLDLEADGEQLCGHGELDKGCGQACSPQDSSSRLSSKS